MKILYGSSPVKSGDFACFINPKFVLNLEVVEFALRKAIKNWNAGKRISKSLAVEILLYFSATRQIEVAKKLSAKEKAVVVVLDEEKFSQIGFLEEEFQPSYDLEAIIELYDISKEEIEITGIEKLPLLVKERIALFSIFGE